ncbi:MAG: DsbA family protein, partial [Halioglobus sp.]|nr:DsbA family protein [Halioglobus sp.]
MPTLYYFHDPMCSWCWGYRPSARQLFSALPRNVERVNILGGLAPDSDEAMPLAERAAIAAHWRRIENMLGTEFNHDFWSTCEPRRSSYPACRAVLAAARQGQEEAMILAIQEAYYLHAQNPSDDSTLLTLAESLDLDRARFNADLHSPSVNRELRGQVLFARQSPISGFPSLVLDINGNRAPISVDYKDPDSSLRE